MRMWVHDDEVITDIELIEHVGRPVGAGRSDYGHRGLAPTRPVIVPPAGRGTPPDVLRASRRSGRMRAASNRPT
jgi:hypothetical protein